MRDTIERLRAQAAARLEPDAAARAALLDEIARYAEGFLHRLPDAPAYRPDDERGRALYAAPIAEEPAGLPALLDVFARDVERPGINPASPGFLGYIPGGGVYYAALGDYLAAVTDRYAGVFFASPGAVRLERILVNWLASIVGYPAGASGDLTPGGSIANLSAVVTARHARGVRARDVERTVVYLSAQTHHSVARALRLAGLDECVTRTIPLDARYRMRVDALEQAIVADARAGLIPWLVVAAAGTTDTGAVDPLADLAAVAHAHGLWLHTDGAYGGCFVLTETGKALLRGIDQSDSVVLDPHKGLFLPYGTGAVLVRDGRALQAAYHYEAHYMQDAEALPDETSPADVSPELTRHFRGLRLWLPLKLAGVAAFRAALDEKLLLARYFHEALQAVPGFEVGPPPDLSIVTFRYVPEQGDANEFNQRLVQALQQDGRVFLSSTTIDGKFVIRLAVLSFRTHLEHIDLALDALRDAARQLEPLRRARSDRAVDRNA